jgi:hypothetical protein
MSNQKEMLHELAVEIRKAYRDNKKKAIKKLAVILLLLESCHMTSLGRAGVRAESAAEASARAPRSCYSRTWMTVQLSDKAQNPEGYSLANLLLKRYKLWKLKLID